MIDTKTELEEAIKM